MSDKFEKIVPKVKADDEEDEDEEEMIDPGMEIKEACAAGECAKYKARYEECNERVSGKSKTTETCMEEVLDFYHCIDHCNASKVFDKLK